MKLLSLQCQHYGHYFMPFSVALTVLAALPAAHAQSGTWTNPATGGLWSNAANWAGGVIADGSGYTADFGTLNLTADQTVALDSARTLAGLTFGDTDAGTPASWILTNNGDPLNVLTLDGTATITVNALGTGSTTTVGAPLAGAAGLIKAGAGQLNLSGANTFAGTTNVNAGILSLETGGVINAGALNTAAVAGARLVVNGGSLTSSALCTFNQTGGGFLQQSGSTSLNGGLRTANADGSLIRIDGGTFTATTLELRRTSNPGFLTTTDASATSGLYVTGGTVTIATLNAGTSNSSVTARIDGGVVTITGNANIGGTTNTRNSVLQVKGGVFNSTDTLNGVVLGYNTATGNPAEFYLTGGTSTVEKISMGASSLVTAGSGEVYLNGGTLYVGSGGVEKRGVSNYTARISLIAGTLGAKADWSTDVNLNTGTSALNNAVIKAADAADVPFNIRLNGIISGSSGFTKSGGGTLVLTGNNIYNGSGGTGTVISGGILQVGVGGTSGTLGTGTVTNHAGLVFNRSDALTMADIITGTGTLTKMGAGTLTLSADNTLSATTVSGGTLLLANPTGSATGTGPVTVQSGAALAGTGSAGGPVTVAAGGQLAPGIGVGTLTAADLTLSAGSELQYEFNGTPANDRITVTGTLTLNGGAVRLRQENSPNPWSSLAKYYLIKYGTLAGAGIGALTVASPVSGVVYTFGTETVGPDQFITLTLSSAGTPNTWNVDAAGTWDTAGNWSTGIPGGVGNPVNFLGAISTARTVTLDTPRTAGSLTFDNGNAYTLAGAALTFDNAAAAAAATSLTGFHRINTAAALPALGLNTTASLADAVLEFGGIVSGPGAIRHLGPGTLRLSAANAFSGGTSVGNNGTVEAGGGGSLGSGAFAWTGNGTLRALSSTTLTADASVAAAAVGRVDSAGNALTLSGVISGAGTLAKTGAGYLTLSNTNLHAGGTRFEEGEVVFGALANLGSGGLIFNGGGLFWGPANTTDISTRPVSLLAGGGSLNTGANNVTLASAIGDSGPGDLSKYGTGTLTLGAANSYTGRTRILEGTLAVAAPENLGPAPAALSPGQLTIDGGIFQPAVSFDLPANTGVAVGAAAGTVNVAADVALGIPAGISDRDAAPGRLNLNGAGTVTLTKNSTFSGGGTAQAVTVNANASNCLGSGVFTLEGTTLNAGGNVNLPNGFIVNGTAVINLSNATTGSTLTGPLSGSGSLTVNTPGVRSQVSGDWTAFSGDLNLAGNGEWRITGFNDTFTNARVNVQGTTQLVLAVNPSVGVPRVIRIGQLSGTGSVGGHPVVGRLANWVVGGLNTNSTFDGIFKDNMSQLIGTGNASSQVTKEGTGTLTLTGNSTYTGTTTVTNGKLLINGDNSLAVGAVTVSGGTLGGSGTIGGAVTVQAAGLLAPGAGIGTLTTAATTLEGGLLTEYDNAGLNLIDKLVVNGDLTLAASSQLVLQAVGAFPGGAPRVIASYTGMLTGTFGTISGLPAGYAINYAWNDGISSNNIAIVTGFANPAYTAWAGSYSLTGADAQPGADPDKDGAINLLEFALDGNPSSPVDSGKSRPAVTTVGADQAFTLTLAVRDGAVFSGAAAQTATIDGITYTIQGSDDVLDWTAMPVSEVTPAAAADLPALNPGWTYRTFRTPGTVSADNRDNLRLKVAAGS